MKPCLPFAGLVSDRSGQFAIITAIMAVPLLAGVGLAVDYMSMAQVKSRLRDSNDAAALYAATLYRQKGSLPVKKDVAKFLSEDFKKATGEAEPVITRYELKDGKVYVNSQVDDKMMIMQIFGHDKVVIPGSSVVNVGSDESVEIALALDTTASMLAYTNTASSEIDPDGIYFTTPVGNVTRIQALKFSASQFTTTLFKNVSLKDRVRIAVVPFDKYVNVGLAARSEPWMNVPPDQAANGPEQCYEYQPVISSSNCREEFTYVDGAKVPYTACDYVYGPKQTTCYKTGGSSWHGCVGSREEPLNLRDASPSAKFPGIMDEWCASQMQPLSSSETAVLTTINNLWTSGNTYIPEGVMWGMRMLSTLQPYTEVKSETAIKKVRKILVLMTDGDNQAVSQLPSLPSHRAIADYESDFAKNKSKTDDWTMEACKQAIANGLEVYTISFGTDISMASRKLIEKCATDKDHYFDAKDADALNKAFQSIAADVGGFYLSG